MPGVMDLYQQGRLEQAWQLGRRVLAEHPSDVGLLNLLGVIGWQLRQYQAAHGYLVKSLSLQPRQAGAYVNLGLVLQAAGRRPDALACFDRALALTDLPAARLNKAACLVALHRYREALDVLQPLLGRPDVDPQAALNAAVACRELGRFDDALTWYTRVLQRQPDSADALRQHGECLARAGRIDEGIGQVERALAIAPQSAMVWLALARIRSAKGDRALALQAFEKATECGPDIVDAWIGLARELQRQGEYAKALETADRAVAVGPSDAAAWLCRASIRMDVRQFAESLNDVDEAVRLAPAWREPYLLRAQLLGKANRYHEAVEDLEKARSIDGEWRSDVGAQWLVMRAHMADWREREELLAWFDNAGADGLAAIPALHILATFDAAGLQRSVLERVAQKAASGEVLADFRGRPQRIDGRLRVGYLSPDFRYHAVMTVLGELFAQHDRGDFEWYAYSLIAAPQDPAQQRVMASFDHFVDVSGRSDEAIVDLIRSHGIDVLIDLAGHTEGARLGVLRRRAAPAQVTYIGYPGTTAVPAIDYIFGSPIVTPTGSESWFTEQPIRLPWLVPVSPRTVSDRVWTRAEAGLPQDAVVFCSFNNTYKFTPEMFGVWMNILRQVDGSVLWLYAKAPEVEVNLRREAQARGVDPARLYFAGAVDMPNYLARMRLADLFLDTHPYNAHTTALDAVWAGLPVLTFEGGSFVSRMAAGVLSSIGLRELVAADVTDYEARAVALGRAPARLVDLRRRLLSPEMQTSPPFDAARFARYLEAAYRAMHERAAAGLPPAPMEVSVDGQVTVLQSPAVS